MAYTTINKSSLNFNTKLYTGNGGNQTITGVGFTPDFVWFKSRDAANSNALVDIVRGTNKVIYSDTSGTEQPIASQTFNSDGFALVNDGGANSINSNGSTKVAWSWKANGAGSANTAGSINSTVSVNTTAGFSISSYAGSNSNATIGHGLGVAPKMFIIKNLSGTRDWSIYHESLGNAKVINLNNTNAAGATGQFASTSPTSTVFTVAGDYGNVNQSGVNYIAYCFAEKQGYSKFGAYIGNGNADGAFVYTGFKPAFVMIKQTTGTGNWGIIDNKRPGYNQSDKVLKPNTAEVEATGWGYHDLLSNGFKMRGNDVAMNASGTYIYMAFAEAPLVGTNNVPCTAR